jgi:hypothetical protein
MMPTKFDLFLLTSFFSTTYRSTTMQTPIAKKLGIEVPIFAFTHCRDVVVAVSKAGGLGVLGAVGFSPEELKQELDWIDQHIGDHIYGVDIVIPQKYEGMGEMDPARSWKKHCKPWCRQEHHDFCCQTAG